VIQAKKLQEESDDGLPALEDDFVVYLSVYIQRFCFWNNPALEYRSDMLGGC
jgi:hypothetical protein